MFRPYVVVLAVLLAAPALALPVEQPPNAPPLPTLVEGAPSEIGFWQAPFEGQIPAVHVALLPDQRVLYWSGDVAGDRDQIYFLSTVHGAEVRVLAPPYDAASVSVLPNPSGADLFCSGHTILPDGRIMAAGGSVWHATVAEQDTSFVDGVADTRIFDWRTNAWTRAADMNVPRWYPTVMTTSEGGLATSGIHRLTDPLSHQPSMERYDADADEWNLVLGGTNVLPLYPRLFEVPSGPMKGDLYYETGGTLWGPFGERPEEATWNLAQAYDPETDAWRILGPSIFGARQSPNNVMLPLDPASGYETKILSFAGTLQRSVIGTAAAEIADLSVDPPARSLAAPLHTPRWQSTGILLPNGQVLAVGGALYDNVMTFGTPDPAVMTAELYDPESDAWTQMAPMTIPREYHGTALLLPDARVLVGGHVPNPVPWTALRDNIEMANQSPQTRFEIFEPPYLHWGVEQPVLTGAPDHVGYGERFNVGTPDAERVVDAILVRHGAVTHSSDPGQRGIVLPVVEATNGRLTFDAPADADLATPGPYMLFLRVASEHGLVPGIARTIMVG